MTLEQAKSHIRQRMGYRQSNFLTLAKKLIHENHKSTYRKLLLWAGCEYKDLEGSMKHQGVENTLEKLRDEVVQYQLIQHESKRFELNLVMADRESYRSVIDGVLAGPTQLLGDMPSLNLTTTRS